MKRNLIVILSLLALCIATAAVRLAAQEQPARVVTISAKKFEFTPNQITLKRGEAVTLRVISEDVGHGLYQKELKLDLDLTPDHASEVALTPEKVGRFVAICDHFCGSGHGNMKLIINVE